MNLTAAGAASGSFWGLLVGVLFLNPLIGVAVGAASGAIGAPLSDVGNQRRLHEGTCQSFSPAMRRCSCW